MKSDQKALGILSLIFFGFFLMLTFYGDYIYDGTRTKHRYTVPIPGDESENLVYYEWDPTPGSPDRNNHVVFLFAGFLAQQTMMFPLMREFTRQGYHVVTGDFRGHGESGGEFTMNWTVLLDDFRAIYNAVKDRHGSEWNMTHIAVCGHSMGGFASIMFGYYCDFVFTTVAFAPAPYKGYINETRPQNLMIIIGSKDQAFTEEITLELFRKAVPNGEPGILYGDPLKGTAKKLVIARWARHENELIDDYCLSQAVSFVEWGFGYMKPGDDFIANQQLRMDIIELGLFFGMLGICFLFFFINHVDFKSIANPILTKLFEKITWILPSNLTKEKEEDELDILYETEEVNYRAKDTATLLFLRDWFKDYLGAALIASALLMLSYLVIHDFFSNLQIFIQGVPGFANLFVALENYKREKKEYKSFRNYLKPIKHQIKREFTLPTIAIGIGMYALSMFVVLFGFGQNYMFLFPMNKRAINLVILFPYIFVMYLLQAWGYIFHLVARVRNEKYGFWKALAVMLFTKHFAIYVISIVLLFMGNEFFTIFALLIIFDLMASVLLLINYWYHNNFGSVLLWASLTLSTVYLGYAGVINGWEIFFGTYNAFYWIG